MIEPPETLRANPGAGVHHDAIAKMGEAYNASVVYSPKDLDIYGLALIESGKVDEAQAVFGTLVFRSLLPQAGR